MESQLNASVERGKVRRINLFRNNDIMRDERDKHIRHIGQREQEKYRVRIGSTGLWGDITKEYMKRQGTFDVIYQEIGHPCI